MVFEASAADRRLEESGLSATSASVSGGHRPSDLAEDTA